MTESPDADSQIEVTIGTTLVGVAILMGVAYLCDRTYRRWLTENHPLAEHRARMRRLSTGYQRKRSIAQEVAEIVTDVLDEVARALSVRDVG